MYKLFAFAAWRRELLTPLSLALRAASCSEPCFVALRAATWCMGVQQSGPNVGGEELSSSQRSGKLKKHLRSSNCRKR